MDQITAAFTTIHGPPRRTIRLGSRSLDVYIADTPIRWAIGMVGQSADVDGMLFVMPIGSRMAFHMAKVAVPLLIGFFDPDGTLVDLGCMEAETGGHIPRRPYAYALEVFDAEDAGALIVDMFRGLDTEGLR